MAYNGYGGYNSYPYSYVNPYQQPAQPYNQPAMPQMQQGQAQQPQQSIQPTQTQIQAVPQNINKIYVTSLEDALARFANVNTITVYHLQDESAEIEIATDGFGKKSFKMRKLSDFAPPEKQNETQVYATEEYTKGLQRQILELEERLKSIETQVAKTGYDIKKTEALDE